MTASRLFRFPRLLMLGVSIAASGTALALPSCPTLIYEGVTPAANGLIDPGKPTVTFRFNRFLVPGSVTGAAVLLEAGPTIKRGSKLWTNMPGKVVLFDDYGNPVPTDGGRVDGKNIHVTPMANLSPNRKYRYLIQAGTGYPLLADYPDSWSRTFCSQPRITYNIAAEFYTRPNATGGCVSGPTPVTTNRYGLVRGCRFNISYESYEISNEEEEFTETVWGWGHAKFSVRSQTGYPINEQRGVKITIKNITWNGSRWVAESAIATITGMPATPQSPPAGTVIGQMNNVIVAYNDDILLFENYIPGVNGNRQDLVANGDVRGYLTLSP